MFSFLVAGCLHREFTVRDFGLIEGDRRSERTAEGFVSVVSICQPVASHAHAHI